MERRNMTTVWVIVIVVVVLVGLYMSGMLGSLTGGKNKSEYQAVFLTNGQVYFGKVANASGSTVKVNDIYYLRVQQQVQPVEGDKQTAAQPDVKLVKLGNEIHGPMDEMRINHDQLLFIEDLKEDGKVVTAIRDFQRNGETKPAATTPTESTSTDTKKTQ